MKIKDNKAKLVLMPLLMILTLWAGACDFSEDEIMDGKEIYFGNLHSHTAFSDGKGSPREAFTWARDVAGFDFYAVTDHAESIFLSEWPKTGSAAEEFNEDDSFVAIRGFEYSHAIMGHICVWNTDTYTNSILLPMIPLFYQWLDRRDALAQFNHPGREIGVFRNFMLYENVIDNMVAIETGNKDTGNNDGEYIKWYGKALDAGWRVAPTSNQDNHSLSTNCHRTAVIANGLTREDILEALAERRVYSTDDPDMRVVFKTGQAWMGSEVAINSPCEVSLIAAVRDNEPIASLELYTNKGSLVAREQYNDGRTETLWQPKVMVNEGTYIYLVVNENNTLDEDEPMEIQKAVTAPIWFIGSSKN